MLRTSLIKKKSRHSSINQICYTEIKIITTYKEKLLLTPYSNTNKCKVAVELCDGFILAFEQVILSYNDDYTPSLKEHPLILEHRLQQLLTISQHFYAHELSHSRTITLTPLEKGYLFLANKFRPFKRSIFSGNSAETPLQTLDKLLRHLQYALSYHDKLIKDSHFFTEWSNKLTIIKQRHLWQTWVLRYAPTSFPKTLTLSTRKALKGLSPTIFNTLYYDSHWDYPAITTFFVYLYSLLKTYPDKSAEALIYHLLLHDARLIGSPLYTKMFEASRLSPLEKTELVLTQLGAELDDFYFLQLTGSHRFDSQMAPHALFITLFCQTVRAAYNNQELTNPKLHQLRMYFDKQNITYIRQYFPRETDEASLEAYRCTPIPLGLGHKKLLRQPARFHNKYPKTLPYHHYQARYLHRKRLTPNFHSEFILNQYGEFVSQWNVLKTSSSHKIISDPNFYDFTDDFKRELLNGESLNYGTKNNQEHRRLDSVPPLKYDHQIRNYCKKGWKSPSLSDYNFNLIDPKK